MYLKKEIQVMEMISPDAEKYLLGIFDEYVKYILYQMDSASSEAMLKH